MVLLDVVWLFPILGGVRKFIWEFRNFVLFGYYVCYDSG